MLLLASPGAAAAAAAAAAAVAAAAAAPPPSSSGFVLIGLASISCWAYGEAGGAARQTEIGWEGGGQLGV